MSTASASPVLSSLRALRAAGLASVPGAVPGALPAGEPAPAERAEAAELALLLGYPRRAAGWAAGTAPLTQAAALLRLGEVDAAFSALAALPDTDPRAAVLRARASLQQGGADAETARAALSLARQSGDGPALVAAATLHAETLLHADPRAALHALAAGLNACERLGVEADPLLLAVLAHAQRRVGSPAKAARTAQKALERGWPGSPARVVALLALGRAGEAGQERAAGELAAGWLRPYLAPT